MKKILLIFLLIFEYNSIKAAVFTVTSKGDAGLGTLREAINLANSNGIIQTDYIYFNLPGNSIPDVTIALESELPKLTSNLVIDATTQPFAILGNPNIKVILIRVVPEYFSGLRLDNSSSIEIYGLSFSNFKSDPQGEVDQKKAGIFLLNTSDVIIGAPNKPNCFNNNYAGILSPYIIPRTDNVNIKISANIIGLGENGLSIQPNEVGIDLSFLKNSTIGGNTPQEGNLITSNTNKGIALGGADGNIEIINNIIGLDKTLLKAIPSAAAIGISVDGQSSIPLIAKNTICVQSIGIEIVFVNGGFAVSNNKIGTSITGNENFGNTTGIHIKNCNKGVIGGSLITDENKIAYNKTGVLIEIAYPISILKNSFYCNSIKAIAFKDLPTGKTVTQSKITTITTTNASGDYLPNSKIELFYTDSCPDCQGKTWFATLLTDANGRWNYDGPITGKITSMGTNADGATGTFSKPIINSQNVIISGVVCGQTTGSIEVVDIFDASVFQWYNLNNQLVGSTKILTGVGSGTYYLKAGQLGACDVVSASFTIDASSNGINDLQQVITDTYCGAAKGSIENIIVANNLSRTWYTISGQIISTADDLKDVVAGVYYFKAGQGSCEIVSKNYTIKNIEVSYKVNVLAIVPETCGKSNGSITINNYETLKPDRFEWKDAQGNLISTTENLQNLIAGKYILTAYGNNGCSNKVGEFIVPASQLPIIDYNNLQQLVSCDGKTVSTSGITINGSSEPYRYQWFNENSVVVYAQINLAGVPPGKYTLSLIDKNGCTVNGRTLDFIALPNSPLVIPNSITPNGDGINDDWQIKGVINYPMADFSIYNRNGSRIFYTKGYTKPFDGRFNGALLPIGVYYYVIDLKTNCNAISGSLTIIR